VGNPSLQRLSPKEVPAWAELFFNHYIIGYPIIVFGLQGMLMKDKVPAQERPPVRLRRGDDGLGANSDIGAKLRALYGSVQDEPIPGDLLDLLEQLDQAEQKSKHDPSRS
jgi:hypothetical protein